MQPGYDHQVRQNFRLFALKVIKVHLVQIVLVERKNPMVDELSCAFLLLVKLFDDIQQIYDPLVSHPIQRIVLKQQPLNSWNNSLRDDEINKFLNFFLLVDPNLNNLNLIITQVIEIDDFSLFLGLFCHIFAHFLLDTCRFLILLDTFLGFRQIEFIKSASQLRDLPLCILMQISNLAISLQPVIYFPHE
jgi:hypothetical protein